MLFVGLSIGLGLSACATSTVQQKFSFEPKEIDQQKIYFTTNEASNETTKSGELLRLNENREKWNSHGIDRYKLIVANETCWCLYAPYYGPNLVSVSDSEVRSVEYQGRDSKKFPFGTRLKKDKALSDSVEDLFKNIETRLAYAEDGYELVIIYDPEYGIPIVFDYDHSGIDDEQSRVVVREFKFNPDN